MPTTWKTYPLEFKGGLVSNLSPLQHGMQLPNSARVLSNFEPSVQGGFRRIEGFQKFDDNQVKGDYRAFVISFLKKNGPELFKKLGRSGIPRIETAVGLCGKEVASSILQTTSKSKIIISDIKLVRIISGNMYK